MRDAPPIQTINDAIGMVTASYTNDDNPKNMASSAKYMLLPEVVAHKLVADTTIQTADAFTEVMFSRSDNKPKSFKTITYVDQLKTSTKPDKIDNLNVKRTYHLKT